MRACWREGKGGRNLSRVKTGQEAEGTPEGVTEESLKKKLFTTVWAGLKKTSKDGEAPQG